MVIFHSYVSVPEGSCFVSNPFCSLSSLVHSWFAVAWSKNMSKIRQLPSRTCLTTHFVLVIPHISPFKSTSLWHSDIFLEPRWQELCSRRAESLAKFKAPSDRHGPKLSSICCCIISGESNQWPLQEPKLEVPTIYKAYCSGLCKGKSPQNMALYGTVQPF
jgi:hypothetical protein